MAPLSCFQRKQEEWAAQKRKKQRSKAVFQDLSESIILTKLEKLKKINKMHSLKVPRDRFCGFLKTVDGKVISKKKIKLNSIKIFVQGQNLYTITKYRGYDPEVPGSGVLNGGAQYPTLKTVTAGINLGF